MIELSEISVVLGGQRLLDGLSLRVARGEKVAVSGESGSGKTTMLKTIIGWHRPLSGSLRIDDLELGPDNLEKIRSKTFYLQQDITPNGDETVREYLAYPFTMGVNKGKTFSKEAARSTMAGLRLKDELIERPLHELSGGERKRVALGRGLLLGRSVYLLDEPTSSVDAGNREAMVDLLLSMDQATVLAITHDGKFMGRANRHMVLEGGKLREVVG